MALRGKFLFGMTAKINPQTESSSGVGLCSQFTVFEFRPFHLLSQLRLFMTVFSSPR